MFLLPIGGAACGDGPPEASDPDGDRTEETFELGPMGTFLRTSAADTPDAPLIVDLAARGIDRGDVLVLAVAGTYLDDASLDASDYAMAVFASSDTLLAPSEAHRVPDAIEAGVDYATDPTYEDELPTDIPEDFRLDGDGLEEGITVSVGVPTGATHLFVGVGDRHLVDNSTSEAGFRFVLVY